MDVHSLIGRRLGDYHLRQFIGRGGMGAVFRADHAFLDLPYAVKVLAPALAVDQSYLKRFFFEAKQAARIHDPHVVSVNTAGKDGAYAYIAMEYVPGHTLKRAVSAAASRRLDPRTAAEAVRHGLRGLDAAHRLGIVHRDIKPDNLLLAPSGTVKVADFGLARAVETDAQGMTRPGQVLGTPGFMAIEQWENESVDARADLYALGVTFYYLLSGRLPYLGDTVSALLVQVARGVPTPILEAAPEVPEPLGEFVHRLMARHAKDRPDSAASALFELEAWCESHHAQAGPDGAPDLAALAESLRQLPEPGDDGTARHLPNTSSVQQVGSMAATMTDMRPHTEPAHSQAGEASESFTDSRLIKVPAGSGIAAVTSDSVIDLMRPESATALRRNREDTRRVMAPPPPPRKSAGTAADGSHRLEFAPSFVDSAPIVPSGSGSSSSGHVSRPRQRLFAPPPRENDTDAWSARPPKPRRRRWVRRALVNLAAGVVLFGLVMAGIAVADRLGFDSGQLGNVLGVNGVTRGPAHTVRLAIVLEGRQRDADMFRAIRLNLPDDWRHGATGIKWVEVHHDPTNWARTKQELERAMGGPTPCVAVVSVGNSATTRRLAEITDPLGVPLIAAFATDPELTASFDYVTSVAADDAAQAAACAEFALRRLAARGATADEPRAVVLYRRVNYSRAMADAFEEAFNAGGGLVVGKQTVDEDSLYDTINLISVLRADTVFLPIPWADANELLLEAHDLGHWKDVLVVGTDPWDSPELYVQSHPCFETIACYFATHFHPLHEHEGVTRFLKRYRDRFLTADDAVPPDHVALAYDTGVLLADVLWRCVELDDPAPTREHVHHRVRHTINLVGTAGAISIVGTGRSQRPLAFLHCTTSGPRFVAAD